MASKVISEAMHRNLHEVFTKTPSTVVRQRKKKKGAALRKQLFAIAASKTREGGGSVFK